MRRIMHVISAIALAAVAVLGVGVSASAPTAQAEPCNGTYTHCETNQCQAATFYLNYNPTTDNFSSPHGRDLVYGEQGNIRDEPYRRYGPRGVRAMHYSTWGFFSRSCFP